MKSKTITLLAAATLIASSSMAVAADASANWNQYCAGCHAKDGSGNTMMGKKDNVADYSTAAAQSKFTDAEAVKTITEGKGKMKSFSDRHPR